MAKHNIRRFMLISLCWWLGLSCAQADTRFTFYGEASKEVAPDEVYFSINVQAQCFPSARLAAQAADEMSQKVIKTLEKTKASQASLEWFSRGGFTNRFYPNREQQALCSNTFQKRQQIRVKVSQDEQFGDWFNGLQTQLLALGPESEAAQDTIVTLGEPMPRVSEALQSSLSRQLINEAIQTTKATMASVAKEQSIGSWALDSVEVLPGGAIPQREFLQASMARSAAAPVAFEPHTVSVRIKAIYDTYEKIDQRSLREKKD